jgi:predicted MFS family arabinose efflux permease
MFLTGLAVFTGTALASALAPSAHVLDVCRAAQGVGAAMLYGSASPLLAAEFPAGRERNRALGVLAASSGAAIVTAPLLGGLLTDALGWRALFVVSAAIAALALAVAVRVVRESRDPSPRPLDLRATGYLTVALVAAMWTLIEARGALWVTASAIGLAVAAGARLVLRRVPRPMIDFSLLRDGLYNANAIAAFAFHAAGAGAMAYFALYVQGPMAASPGEAGLWFLSYSLPALGAPLMLGRVAHRVPPAAMVAASPLLTAVSCALLAVSYGQGGFLAMVPGLVVGGVGCGIGNLISSQVALAAAPPERAGVASGITNTAKQFGIAAGVAGLGVPYELGGIGAVLTVAAILATAGGLPALLVWATASPLQKRRPPARRGRPRPRPPAETSGSHPGPGQTPFGDAAGRRSR